MFNFIGGSSLLTIVTLVGLIVLVGVILILPKMKSNSSENETSREQRKPTKLKNINAVSLEYNLKNSEKDLLWEICKAEKASNIEYLIHSSPKMVELFGEYYKKLISSNVSEKKLHMFFLLLFKIEQANTSTKEISSSRNIPDGTVFIYMDNLKRSYPLTLVSQDKDALYLRPSEIFSALNEKPKELEKIELQFSLQEDMNYKIATRVMRYDTTSNGKEQLLLAHSNTLTRLKRRKSKRDKISLECKFASYKMNNNSISKAITTDTWDSGLMKNLSMGGCALVTPKRMDDKRSICLNFSVDNVHTDSVVGIVLASRKLEDKELFIYHVKFISITLNIKNKISSTIYNFKA